MTIISKNNLVELGETQRPCKRWQSLKYKVVSIVIFITGIHDSVISAPMFWHHFTTGPGQLLQVYNKPNDYNDTFECLLVA